MVWKYETLWTWHGPPRRGRGERFAESSEPRVPAYGYAGGGTFELRAGRVRAGKGVKGSADPPRTAALDTGRPVRQEREVRRVNRQLQPQAMSLTRQEPSPLTTPTLAHVPALATNTAPRSPTWPTWPSSPLTSPSLARTASAAPEVVPSQSQPGPPATTRSQP